MILPKMNIVRGMVSTVVFVSVCASAFCGPVTILNPSFENPAVPTVGGVADWTVSDGGVWNINDDPAGFWTVPAPDGKQIAYVSSAPHPGAPASISQILTTTLAANSHYELSGFVGHPIGFDTSDGTPTGVPTIYTAALYAGGNLLGLVSGTGPSGKFSMFDLNFDSTGSPFVGAALEIRLSSSQAQTGFDAISLNVPDGGSTSLLLGMGMIIMGWMRRRIR